VLVSLQPRGEKLLEKVVEQRIIELRANGRALVETISALLETGGPSSTNKKKRQSRLRPRPGRQPSSKNAVN